MKLKKLLLLTLSDNDAEALSALRKAQEMAEDWHKLVEKACGESHDTSDGFDHRADAGRYYAGFAWANPRWQRSPEEQEAERKAEAAQRERDELARAFERRSEAAKAKKELDDLLNRFASRVHSNVKREASQAERNKNLFRQAGFGEGPLGRHK